LDPIRLACPRAALAGLSAQHADDDQDQQDDEQCSETDVHVATSKWLKESVPIGGSRETVSINR
jgi:hypothetical protein